MAKLKIIPMGSKAAVALPGKLLAKLGVGVGDTLYVRETPNGIELTPHAPESAEQLGHARQVMSDNKKVLRKLAQ